jgi:hypothetical protein
MNADPRSYRPGRCCPWTAAEDAATALATAPPATTNTTLRPPRKISASTSSPAAPRPVERTANAIATVTHPASMPRRSPSETRRVWLLTRHTRSEAAIGAATSKPVAAMSEGGHTVSTYPRSLGRSHPLSARCGFGAVDDVHIAIMMPALRRPRQPSPAMPRSTAPHTRMRGTAQRRNDPMALPRDHTGASRPPRPASQLCEGAPAGLGHPSTNPRTYRGNRGPQSPENLAPPESGHLAVIQMATCPLRAMATWPSRPWPSAIPRHPRNTSPPTRHTPPATLLA